MNAFKNHTNVPKGTLSAALVIRSLMSELYACAEVMDTLKRFMPAHQLIHAKLDLQARGNVDQNLLRHQERGAVLAMAAGYLAGLSAPSSASQDIVKRLRTVAGQTVIKPPALDLEAADYIERLEAEIAEMRAFRTLQVERVGPALKPGLYQNFGVNPAPTTPRPKAPPAPPKPAPTTIIVKEQNA